MRDIWLELVGRLLRPARERIDHCLTEKQRHQEARRVHVGERAKAIARCEARIEALRADVFAARDGVVTSQMTELEREWRRLSRADHDGEHMDLWARVAPSSWLDRKRWRDAPPAAQTDAAIALASDVEGVETAEAAVSALRTTLVTWQLRIGPRIRWRPFERDFEGTAEILDAPLRAVQQALAGCDGEAVVLAYARRLGSDVREGVSARLPDRPILASAVGHAAFVDCLWRASSLPMASNPVTPLLDLWTAGYAVSAIDRECLTLEIPPL